jgi:hypothetical protein
VGADLNAYAYVQGEVLSAIDPVGLDSAPKQEKADLSGLAVNGVIPDRALVVPGQKGYIGSSGSDYEKFRSQAKVEYTHDASAVPIELKKITILLGDGAKPESKAAREFGYLGALVNGQGQDKKASGASADGIVGGTNPDGLEGAGWQTGVAAVNIAGAFGFFDALVAKGVGVAARGVSALVREVGSSALVREMKAIRDIGNLGDDFGSLVAKDLAEDLKKMQHRLDVNQKPALPESYWVDKKAPTQVSPGIRTVNIDKPSSKGGTYHSTSHYDEYGRLIGQTHRTDHARPHDHPSPHHHRRNPKTGEQLKDPRTGSRTWPGLFGNLNEYKASAKSVRHNR